MKRVVIFDSPEYNTMDNRIRGVIDDLKWLRRHTAPTYQTFIQNIIIRLETVQEILTKEEKNE